MTDEEFRRRLAIHLAAAIRSYEDMIAGACRMTAPVLREALADAKQVLGRLQQHNRPLIEEEKEN